MKANVKATYYLPRVLVPNMTYLDEFTDHTSLEGRLLHFAPNRYISHRAGESVVPFEVRLKGRKKSKDPTPNTSWSGRQSGRWPFMASGGMLPTVPPQRVSPTAGISFVTPRRREWMIAGKKGRVVVRGCRVRPI